MKNWLKSSAPVAGALAGVVVALVAVLQLVVVGPMNRRFEDLRVHMDQRFEAVDQRFEAVDQGFEAMDRRINDLRSDMNERFNDLRAEMDQRFDAMDRRMDAVERRLGRVEDGLSELRTLSDRVSRNEGHIDVLRDQLQTVDVPTP